MYDQAFWEERRLPQKQASSDSRTPFEKDYSRIIHSASFRRLQGKTQVLNLGESDFYRTRLTHSLEVAQIGLGVLRKIRETMSKEHDLFEILPSKSLIQAICLTHDLGHPPFGHGGEYALNYCMRQINRKNEKDEDEVIEFGGFEGNGQTLRILSKLEHFSDGHGANLTRRTLLGILKYPCVYEKVKNVAVGEPSLMSPSHTATSISPLNTKTCKPPKSYMSSENDVIKWLFDGLDKTDVENFTRLNECKYDKDHEKFGHHKPIYKSFDCSIMDLADDIAFGVHDLEDAIALRLISVDDFYEIMGETFKDNETGKITECGFQRFVDEINSDFKEDYENFVENDFFKAIFSHGFDRKKHIGRLVNFFVSSIDVVDRNLSGGAHKFSTPLFRYEVQMKSDAAALLDMLKKIVVKKVIHSARVQQLEYKGQNLVVSVFEAVATSPKRLLPPDYLKYWEAASNELDKQRVVCDYVAGMTDLHLLRVYDRLFSPRMGSIFEKL